MKICKQCSCEFIPSKPWTKYCSLACSNKFYHLVQMHKRKTDPVIREKYLKSERERKKRKKINDPTYRGRLSAAEKMRQRLAKGIMSDADLKCAPRGSGTITRMGYRQITKKDHPNCNRRGTMFEHVFVMSEHLKRPLSKHENIHHKNGIRHDNRIENLELWSRSQPPGQRVEDKLKWCKEFLEEYGHTVIMK